METTILKGRERIRGYLGISKQLFYDLVSRGLPAGKLCGQWFAHPAELDKWIAGQVADGMLLADDLPGRQPRGPNASRRPG